MFRDLAMFQYYKGLSFGVVIGIALSWLIWRLPVHLRTRRTRKLRRVVEDMRRIESPFKGHGIANTVDIMVHGMRRPPIRARIVDSARDYWLRSTPRTPEQVAQEAYRRELLVEAT